MLLRATVQRLRWHERDRSWTRPVVERSAMEDRFEVRCECGTLLLLGTGERRVRIVTGAEIPFSRDTDHVACPTCLRSYSVNALRSAEGRPRPEDPLFGTLQPPDAEGPPTGGG
jgi:hypothetical protein